MATTATVWVGSSTQGGIPEFVVAGDNVPVKCEVVSSTDLSTALTFYVNGVFAWTGVVTVRGDNEPHRFPFNLVIPESGAGRIHSVYATIGGVTSNTMSFPAIAGQTIPIGTVGVVAITLPANEQKITLNSDNVPGFAVGNYLHPKVYVVSKVDSRRKCWVQFHMDAKTSTGTKFIVEYPVGTDDGGGTFMSPYQTAVLDLTGLNILEVNLREPGDRMSIFGERKLVAFVDVKDFFGNESPSEEDCPAMELPFTVADSSPNTPQLSFTNISIDPGTNRVVFTARNDGSCRLYGSILTCYFVSVDGKRIPGRQWADHGTMHVDLKPGETYDYNGSRSYWDFTPVSGKTHTICLYDDPSDIVTLYDPYEGGNITRPVVEVTKY